MILRLSLRHSCHLLLVWLLSLRDSRGVWLLVWQLQL